MQLVGYRCASAWCSRGVVLLLPLCVKPGMTASQPAPPTSSSACAWCCLTPPPPHKHTHSLHTQGSLVVPRLPQHLPVDQHRQCDLDTAAQRPGAKCPANPGALV